MDCRMGSMSLLDSGLFAALLTTEWGLSPFTLNLGVLGNQLTEHGRNKVTPVLSRSF